METLRSVSQPLANARKEVAETVGSRISELTESLRSLSDPGTAGGSERAANIAGRITELTELINSTVVEPQRRNALR